MDDYQKYIQSGSDKQSTGGGCSGSFIVIAVVALILLILEQLYS